MPEEESRAYSLRQHELCQFLKFARARINPADVGIETPGRRRVSGLRREEVAALCGVSVAWYTWFESGRKGTRASVRFIRAVSEALRLSDDEIMYLFSLAIPEMPKVTCPTRHDIQTVVGSIGAEFARATLPDVTYRLSVCDNFPVGVYCTKPDGSIVYANESLYRLLGYASKSSYLKLNVSRDLYSKPAQRRAWQREIEAKGSILDAEATIRRADGSCIEVRDSAYAVKPADGTGLCYFGTWEGRE